jgi:hypothetical protein
VVLHYLIKNSTLIPISFGVGLLLAGRHFWGLASILIGCAAYPVFKKRHKEEIFHRQERSPKKTIVPFTVDVEETVENEHSASPFENWYYYKDNQVIGPENEAKMIALIGDNIISRQTLVYNAAIGNVWIDILETHFGRYLRRSAR